jgi:hypothetical protein
MVRNEVFIFECEATRSMAPTLPTKYQLIINLKAANALGLYVLISYVLSSQCADPYVVSSLCAELPIVLGPYMPGPYCAEPLMY